MDDIATRKQILHALAASYVQSRQFFASTLREKIFETKKGNSGRPAAFAHYSAPALWRLTDFRRTINLPLFDHLWLTR